jgi:hypothetical protein
MKLNINSLVTAVVFFDTTIIATSFSGGTVYAHQSNKNYQMNKKVFVCKYVGKPHVDERLQTGQNPISVSTHAIQHNGWDGQIPGWFSDAQGRSYVIAYDHGQPEPSVKDCPAPDTKPPVTPPVTPPTTNPGNPGQGGGGHVLGDTTTTATVEPTATLVNTGQNAWVNAIVGLTIIALTLAVARLPRKSLAIENK